VAFFNLEDYEPVEKRLGYKAEAKSFWEDNPNGRIFTRLLEYSGTRFIVEAAIFRTMEDIHPWATGLAEETVQGRGVNATSALENCETSAIGRALANAGYATKGKRASREEMAKVAARATTDAVIQQTKEKLKQTSSEYVPVAKEDDPWTIREAAPVSNVDEAVELVKEIIGGQTQRDIPHCKCGKEMAWKTGNSKGKAWGHFKCAVWNKSTGSGCDTITWYEIAADGSWQPQKAKW
jgi:hypothetical protein